jgi:EAL domain-containing protein (putative c-di-GMP-specific phosphodiesterase class I)
MTSIVRQPLATSWFLTGILEQGQPCAVVPIPRDRMVIGRRPGLDLTLQSTFVSGQHTELVSCGGRLLVHDLGSRNGTFVNGTRVRGTRVGLGDLIQIGDVELRVDRTPRERMDAESTPEHWTQFTTAQLSWLSSQYEHLIAHGSIGTALRPIVSIKNGDLIGYEVLSQSNVAGLESHAKIQSAAQMLGRQLDLNGLCLKRYGSVASQLASGLSLFLTTAPAENLQLETLPFLQGLRELMPDRPLAVHVHNATERSLKSLQDFAAALVGLQVELAFDNVDLYEARYVRTLPVRPTYVRCDASLTRQLDRKPESEKRPVQALVEALRFQGIRIIAQDVSSAGEVTACRDLGFDLLHGPCIGEPMPMPSRPLPETCILSSDDVAVLDELNPGPRPEEEEGRKDHVLVEHETAIA